MLKKAFAILAFALLLVLGTVALGQANPPLDVVLLVDKSSTAPRYMQLLRQAITQVLSSMAPGDRMLLCEFQENTLCLTHFTSDSEEILAALETIRGKAASSANFSDALDLAMDHLEKAAPGSKRAILLASNAGERFRPSAHSQAELVRRARKSGVQIHMIEIATVFGNSTYHTSDSAAARWEQLCSKTGGGVRSVGVAPLHQGIQSKDKELSWMEKIIDHQLSAISAILNQVRYKAAPAPGNADALVEDPDTGTESPVPAAHSSSAVLTADMWKIVGWLPGDTETVMVARGSFTLPNLSPQKNDDDVEANKALLDQLPQKDIAANFELQTLLVMAYVPESLRQRFSNQSIALAVRGLRHPRDSETGEGLMQSEGCLILILDKDLEQNASSDSADPRINQEIIAGQSVLSAQDEGVTVLIAHPRPNTVIIATDRSYLQEVLARLTQSSGSPGGPGRSGRRALPSSLREWNHVDTNARFWAVRHYDRTNADEDPSSPFREDQQGGDGSDHDDQAVGVTFSLDLGKPALITYLTGSTEFMARVKQSRDELEPEFLEAAMTYRELEPGVLEISFPLTDYNSVSWISLKLGWLLGQGIEGL